MVQFRVEDVTTVLDNKKIIENISFTLKRGEVLALVGHNGAGKSTLLKTIMTMLQKDRGQISILETYDQDEQLLQFKSHISYLPEEPILLPELTVMQHFQLYAMSYDIPQEKAEESLAHYIAGFDLKEVTDVYPDELSKGMRQKVQAICALLPDVPVLLIDEPFMGLDVYAKQFIIELMKRKIEAGTSIILTTHQLEMLEGLAHTYLTLQAGKITDRGLIADFDSITRRTDRV